MTWRDILIPESQADPHHWGATAGAHCWIALGPWGVIAIGWDQWTAAWVTPIIYFLLIEAYQLTRFARTRHLIWDSILDTVMIAFGGYAAACLGNDMKLAAVACWGASIVVMAVGWQVRANRAPRERVLTL